MEWYWYVLGALAVVLAVAYSIWLSRNLEKVRDENPAFDKIAASFYLLRHRIKVERDDLRDGLFRPRDAFAMATFLEEEAKKLRAAVTLMPAAWHEQAKSLAKQPV